MNNSEILRNAPTPPNQYVLEVAQHIESGVVYYLARSSKRVYKWENEQWKPLRHNQIMGTKWEIRSISDIEKLSE